MPKQRIILLCVIFFISGCPPKMYGFYRMTNPEPVVVGYGCIEDRVRAIVGIEDLTYGTEEGGRPLKMSGVKPATIVHRFRFSYHSEQLDFWLEQYWDGKVSYHGGARTTERERASALVSLAQPVYSEIEGIIERCGFDNFDELAFGDSI